MLSRRDLLIGAGQCGLLSTLANRFVPSPQAAFSSKSGRIKFGLVTYLWGQDLPLPELIETCAQTGMLGVELRTEHAHGVEPSLSPSEREEVRERFADSPVELVGYGSNAQFHEADADRLASNIELTKSYIHLMHDCGGSGVKVKPNGFVDGVSHESTLEQIGLALRELAAYGHDYGQTIRVEAHGRGTSELQHMQRMIEIADHPNVGVCWNSNDIDLAGEGLGANFDRVSDLLADTVHVREWVEGGYPYDKLIELLVGAEFEGWILLEARARLDDRIKQMTDQQQQFSRAIDHHLSVSRSE